MDSRALVRALRERLEGPPRHVRVSGGIIADLADFVADLRSDPTLTLVAFGGGLAAGCLGTVGLAWVWSWFL
jgi:hypothetical protein